MVSRRRLVLAPAALLAGCATRLQDDGSARGLPRLEMQNAALDPRTGEQRWSFRQYDVTDSGIMTTATDLLFTGGREGYFHALDARTGELLWKASVGGQIVNAPVSYEIDGKQYIATISGNN